MHQGREEVRNPDHQMFGKHRVNISLFTANTGSQVLTEKSGCLIGSCWDILLFWASLEFWGFLFFVSVRGKKKTKTEPGEVSLLVVFSRCLLGLLSLVGEVLTTCLGFYFTYVFSLPCVHKESERQAVSAVRCGDVARLVIQEMSWCTVSMILNTYLSAYLRKTMSFLYSCNYYLPSLLLQCVCIHLEGFYCKASQCCFQERELVMAQSGMTQTSGACI